MIEKSLVPDLAARWRGCWKQLVLADAWYKLLSFIVLAPLFGLLFRGLLWLSGNVALSDVDIALYFAGPAGWVSAILAGTVWLGIIACELTTLLAILAGHEVGRRPTVFNALAFAARRAPAVLRLTGRLIARCWLVLVPILALAAAAYFWILDEYDINYYLREKPWEFQVAVGIGVGLVVLLVVLLARVGAGWFLALPLVVFDGVSPRNALREGQQQLGANRRRVRGWLLGWVAAVALLNALAGMAIGFTGRMLIPAQSDSLTLLTGQVGIMLLCLTISGVVVNILGITTFAVLLFHGYLKFIPNGRETLQRISLSGNAQTTSKGFWTPGRLVAAGVIGSLLSALFGVAALASLQLEDRVQVMAHRGASHAAPENTLAAIRAAVEAGADWVEIDVQETADGEVIVVHDSDFMKLARNDLKVWNATAADLRQIDIGSWFDARFADERTPTLGEVLDLCRGKLKVIIELKYYGHDQQLEQRVADIVDRHNMRDQVMAMSLKPEGVRKIKAIRPEWKCGVLMSVSIGDVRKIEADFLAVNAQFASRDLVNRAHQSAKEIYVWTVNDAATMSMMLNRGVDGLLTDRPDLARNILAQRADMNNTQRLLSEAVSLLGIQPKLGEP